VQQWQDALGIHWTTDRRELAEAIPPAYTAWIGERLMARLEQVAA
jgi:DNA (cytosine-5)-methyltransferase 1